MVRFFLVTHSPEPFFWKMLRILFFLDFHPFLLLANFHQKFDLKNMISTYIKGFFKVKNEPNSPDYEDFIFQIARFLW